MFNTTLDLLSGEEVDYFSLMSQSNITSDWLYSINKALYRYNKKKDDGELSIGDTVDFLNTILAFAGFGFANAKRDVGAVTNALGLPDPFAVFADAAEDRVDVFAKKYKALGGTVPGEPNAVEKKLGGVSEKAAKSNSLFGKLKSAYDKLSSSEDSEDTDDYGFGTMKDSAAEQSRLFSESRKVRSSMISSILWDSRETRRNVKSSIRRRR